jgi:hypothetical protein
MIFIYLFYFISKNKLKIKMDLKFGGTFKINT